MRCGWSVVLVCAVGALFPTLGVANDATAKATPQSVEQALSAWEQASAGLLGVGNLEHQRMYHLHQGSYSAHEIAILSEFRGPVSASDLAQRFEWSLVVTNNKRLLVGVPTDSTEQLFYQSCEVSLDRKTHLPKTVRFTGNDPQTQADELAVVLSPQIDAPNRFFPDAGAKPLRYASIDQNIKHPTSPVRVVEHVTFRPIAVPEFPADVQEAITAWESAFSRVLSLHAKVQRLNYEAASQIEHRAVGEFTFSFPVGIHCCLKPAKIDANQTSDRQHHDGVPYVLLPSPAEFWHYTPTEIRFSHSSGQPVFSLKHREENSGQVRWVSHEASSTEGPVDDRMVPPWEMLFPVSGKKLAGRFQVSLVYKDAKHTALEFHPRKAGDKGQFQRMTVVLDHAKGLPREVNMVSSRGDVESFFAFDYTQVAKPFPQHVEPGLIPLKGEVPRLQPAPTSLHGLP